jgi:very-short-patch-repair endonuclease
LPRVPASDADEFDWLAFEQQGVLTSAQAVALIGRGRVRGKLAAKQWRRVCRGVLVTHNGPLTYGQTLWIAVLAAGPGALLAGLSAARESGLRFGGSGPIHILVPSRHGYADLGRRLPLDLPGVVVHRSGVLPDDHVQVGRPIRTTLPRSLLDAAQWARTDDAARAMVAAAFQQRPISLPEIQSVAGRMPRAKRRSLVLETAHDAAGGAHALSEIDLVRLCRRFRLPRPDLRERRKDAAGRNRYVDAYWRRWRLQVEVDGAHHVDVRHWEADMRRQNEVWVAGDRILRFSAWTVRHRPAEVAAQIRAALSAAGWDAQGP